MKFKRFFMSFFLVAIACVAASCRPNTSTGNTSTGNTSTSNTSTGKTSSAKILAKAVNCETPIDGSPCGKCPSCVAIDSGSATDVLEIDAASNNGVDSIRAIRDEVVYPPSTLKKRVYIVDEVHMLSGSAFNALLKTLEEPPSHVVFILATTELHKLPATIISRCQRFDFRRISTDVLMDRLAYIAENEAIEYERDALRVISKVAQGGMRDAISLLELCAGTQNRVDLATVNETLGSGGRDNIESIVRAIARSNYEVIFSAINDVVASSKDIAVFWQDLISYYRDMLVAKTTAKADKYLDLTENETERLKASSELFTKQALVWHCRILDETLYAMQKAGAAKRIVAEMALIKMCDTNLDASSDALLARVAKLENAVVLNTQMIKQGAVSGTAPNSVSTEAQKSDETLLKAATTEVKEKPSAPKAPITSATDESELRPLRCWNEVAERAAAGDVSILPFLKMARAFCDKENRICVRYPNDFVKNMIEDAKVTDSILAALSVEMKKDVTFADVKFEKLKGTEDLSEFDDLIIN